MPSSMEVSGIVLLVAGAVLVATEIHTFTVYLLAMALACLIDGGLVLGLHISAVNALMAFGVMLVLGMPLAHIARGWLRNDASEQVSQNDKGYPVTVVKVVTEGHLRVSYRGATWDAEMAAGQSSDVKAGDRLWIVERQDNALILARREKDGANNAKERSEQ